MISEEEDFKKDYPKLQKKSFDSRKTVNYSIRKISYANRINFIQPKTKR